MSAYKNCESDIKALRGLAETGIVLLEAVRVFLEAVRVYGGNKFVEAVRFALNALKVPSGQIGSK